MWTRALVISFAITALAGLGASADDTPPATPAPARPSHAALCRVLPRPELRIRLVVEPGVPADLPALVEATVARVWRREGLSIDWQPPQPPDRLDRTTHFWLRLTARWLARTRIGSEQTLGAVRFFGDLPHRDVLVSWSAAREWARRERAREYQSSFTGVSRHAGLDFGGFEEFARQAAAYAAAHEVGHFVLGMKSHDGSGLMRRDLLNRAVALAEDEDLRLSDRSRTRLRQRLALGSTCEPDDELAREEARMSTISTR